MESKIEKALKRIEERIEHDPMTGCANWTGATGGRGYPHITVDGKHVRTARWLWEQINGEIPPGLEISHLCHNPLCVRIHPDHVAVESHAENIRRAGRRGSFSGERNSQARLSTDEVVLLRRLWGESELFPVKRLSELFGVSLRTAYGVINYEVYENVIPGQENFRHSDRVSQTA